MRNINITFILRLSIASVHMAAGLLFSSCGYMQETVKNSADSPSVPAVTISSVSPSAGAATGGTAIVIYGTGFASGATVSIGGAACINVVYISATELNCTTPAGTSGLVTVTVQNSDGTNATKTAAYEYSTSTTGGTSYALRAGGGISTGGGYKLQGSIGTIGVPFIQSGGTLRSQTGIEGVLHGP